ncbi:MAG: DUF1499 domain-containing protein [Pseudomonadota bacterium]|nr:DUF1499 domain-containing protein [Pseudomonadota bacterium]
MRRLILEEPVSRAAILSRRVAVFACLTALAAIVAARASGGRDSLSALAVLAAALLLAGVALLFAGAAAVEIWRTGRRGAAPALMGAALALALIAFPAFLTVQAARLPRINQVTTDFKSPPQYMISLKAREARGSWTPPAPGPEIEAAQRAAYPGLQPMLVDLEPEQAYRMALRIVKDLGWRVVDANPPNLRGEAEGHIDATDRSLFLGFIDDIAIRVRAQGPKTQIDIRSASRVGRHDFGANARRAQRFIDAVQQSVSAR